MAKAVITMSDNPDGNIHLECSFDPDIEEDMEDMPMSQAYALVAIQAVMLMSGAEPEGGTDGD